MLQSQAVRNRRNPFGPVTEAAIYCFVCHTLSYALYPMGLLNAPETAACGDA